MNRRKLETRYPFVRSGYALRDLTRPIGVSTFTVHEALPKRFRRALPSGKRLVRALKAGAELLELGAQVKEWVQ